MARLLLRSADLAHAGLYEGDPVAIVDDSHTFSQEEDIRVWVANGNAANTYPGLFYVIDLVGMPLEPARRLYEQWKRPAVPGDPEYDAPDPEDRCVFLGPHRWQLGVKDRFPPNLANQLRRDYYLEYTYGPTVVTWLNNYIIDRCEVDVFVNASPVSCCGT